MPEYESAEMDLASHKGDKRYQLPDYVHYDGQYQTCMICEADTHRNHGLSKAYINAVWDLDPKLDDELVEIGSYYIESNSQTLTPKYEMIRSSSQQASTHKGLCNINPNNCDFKLFGRLDHLHQEAIDFSDSGIREAVLYEACSRSLVKGLTEQKVFECNLREHEKAYNSNEHYTINGLLVEQKELSKRIELIKYIGSPLPEFLINRHPGNYNSNPEANLKPKPGWKSGMAHCLKHLETDEFNVAIYKMALLVTGSANNPDYALAYINSLKASNGTFICLSTFGQKLSTQWRQMIMEANDMNMDEFQKVISYLATCSPEGLAFNPKVQWEHKFENEIRPNLELYSFPGFATPMIYVDPQDGLRGLGDDNCNLFNL